MVQQNQARTAAFSDGRRDLQNRQPHHPPLARKLGVTTRVPHRLPPHRHTPLRTMFPASSVCSAYKCGQSRLAPDCQRRLCRKHCVAVGGCSSKNHNGGSSTTTSTNIPASQAPATQPSLDPGPMEPPSVQPPVVGTPCRCPSRFGHQRFPRTHGTFPTCRQSL